MYQPASTSVPPIKPSVWFAAAAASLIAGIIIYVFGRPSAPDIIRAVLHKLDLTAQISPAFTLPFAYQLPSFFHMLALLLATVAVTWRQPRLRRPALLATFLLGNAMEFVQHPAVKNILQTCPDTSACFLFSGLTDYALAGTFDRLDVLAISLAACITHLLLRQRYRGLPTLSSQGLNQ